MTSMTPAQRNARASRVIFIVVAVAIAGGAGFWFGNRQASAPARFGAVMPPDANSPPGGPPAERKVLYWHDPMVPGQKFDKPGKSPFMDMQLVPVYADAAADAGKVSISPLLVQNFGIRTATVQQGRLETGFSAVGVVSVDERSIVVVQTRSPGYLEKLHVRAQYDAVAAGQPLADLYVPEWLAAQEEFLTLKASPQPGAAQLADAARHRLQLLGMPDAEIARVERDARPSARVTITAPQAGIVWEIGARDGMAVTSGTTLFKLAALGTVWMTADVPEAQAALVRVGTPVEARVAAYPAQVFKGSVNALLPEVDTATRSVRARIVLGNPGGVLKPGMFATVALGGEAGTSTLLVPAEAVIRTGKRNVVIVTDRNGGFAPVEVEVGRESGDVTEIRKGLSAGQTVVISGQFLVDSEASLKGVLARMGASGSAPAPAEKR